MQANALGHLSGSTASRPPKKPNPIPQPLPIPLRNGGRDAVELAFPDRRRGRSARTEVTRSENLGYFGKFRHCEAPQEPWQSMPL
jgi:hypothetical protein